MSIDEQMIKFRGKSSLRQFMPNKPIRFGFKSWARADPNGFVYDFQIYQGKADDIKKSQSAAKGLSLSSQVVVDLIKGLPPHKGFKIFADNYFSSVALVERLTEMGYWFCGTIRSNRTKGAPLRKEKELKKEARGFSVQFTQDKKVVVQWQDTKTVTLISNYVGREPIGQCRRWDRTKKQYINIDRPHIIEEYNQFRGGVDLSDMLRSMYSFSLKCKRYYIYIFMYVLNLCVRNAWIYFRRCSQKEDYLSLGEFIKEVAKSLIRASPRTPLKTVNINPLEMPTTETHLPLHQGYLGECFVCVKAGNRHRTNIKCTSCMKCFCITKERNCFLEFHKNM